MPIIIEEQSNRRRRTILGSIAAGFILAFLIAFWGELRDVLLMIVQIPNGFTSERFDSLLNLGYNLQWFVLFALAWIVLVSFQALLPAGSFADYLRTAYQFVVYIFGQHGPAVFVKDGKVLSTREDVRDGPGVAVVDFNSAIVLEERLPPPGIGSGYDSAMHRFFWSLGLADKAESPRVMGPGIVYTRSRERIRAAIDLRRQFRMVRGINGYSRNGIEVSTNVWAIFTVGQDPDVVQVTYDGEARPENLRVVNFEALPDGHLRMVSMSDELDRQDRQEIHHHFQVLRHTREIYPYKKIDPPNPLPVFDRD
ncbi:MAG: hypothetical protein HY835_15075, partial [Anaerolineae bacterium]|nr:hypothetical protein [Anaerolineae bacterium]